MRIASCVRFKDEYEGKTVSVGGHVNVMTYLMFCLIVLASSSITVHPTKKLVKFTAAHADGKGKFVQAGSIFQIGHHQFGSAVNPFELTGF